MKITEESNLILILLVGFMAIAFCLGAIFGSANEKMLNYKQEGSVLTCSNGNNKCGVYYDANKDVNLRQQGSIPLIELTEERNAFLDECLAKNFTYEFNGDTECCHDVSAQIGGCRKVNST